MQRSQKPSGHGGIRRALALVAVLAVTAGALPWLTSCETDCGGEISGFRVEPENARMVARRRTQFKLKCYSNSNVGGRNRQDSPVAKWSASGGSISPSGVFVAPKRLGDYTITARTPGGNSYSTNVKVVASEWDDDAQSGEATAGGKPTPVPSGSVAKAEGEKERIFNNGNGLGGRPGGKIPQFTIDRPRVIVEIMTYHWDYNGHRLGTIALKNVETGETYGPWKTVGGTGQGGVKNAYWLAHPNVEIPAGTYKLVDSSPSTWFTNDQAKGFGMATIDAIK